MATRKASPKGAGHGGKRKGAGRPKGGVSKKTQEIRDYIAERGCNPLIAIAEIMEWRQEMFRAAVACGDMDAAAGHGDSIADLASKIAPYVAPRLQAVQATVSGEVGLTVNVVDFRNETDPHA